MSKLDLQNPETNIGATIEISKIAGLINGMWKIRHAMSLDVQIEAPAQFRRALIREGIERGA